MLRNDPRYKDNLTDFQRRYEPNFAWCNAVAGISLLPGLRGFWPMGVHNSSGNAIDHSGLGKTLTYNGNPLYKYAGLYPYIEFDDTGDFLSRVDEADLDILGTEAYVVTAQRGLTFGGWFWHDGNNNDIMASKWTAGTNNRSWQMNRQVGGALQGAVSTTGAAVAATVTSAAGVLTVSTWHFDAMRFMPSTELAVFHNTEKTTTAAGVPASLFNSNADLMIGGISAAAQYDGRATLCWLCDTALSDAIIATIYHQTRALFSV